MAEGPNTSAPIISAAVALQPIANWQYEALSRNSAEVTMALAANRLSGVLAGHLKACGIIGQPVFEQATNYAVCVTEYARVEHLVTAVLTKTKCNTQCYHNFIKVLNFDGIRPDTEAARSLLSAAAVPPTDTTTTSSDRKGARVEESALPRLLRVLSPVVHSWSLFAKLIGVPSSQISSIEAENSHHTPCPSYLFNCFSQSLEWWVAHDRNPTYETILAVLDPKRGKPTSLMNGDLAEQVKEFMAKEQGLASMHASDYTKLNIMKIKGKFAQVLRTVREYLQKTMNEDERKSLRLFILDLFPDISIPDPSDPNEIFEAIRNNRLWSYMNYSLLELIIKQFCRGKRKITRAIENFKKDRAGFLLANKIKEYIPAAKACESEPLNPVIPEHFTKLSKKLDECVADYSLRYLEELWQSLSFHMQLPPIKLLFEMIDRKCVQVDFLIPTRIVSQVIHQAQYSAYFYRQHHIHMVTVGDICVYDSLATMSASPPSATPPAHLQFDMIAELLNAGVLPIVQQIFQSLDVTSLAMTGQVSSIWRDVNVDLPIWKKLIQNKLDSNPLWRGLFKRRGWNKYLDKPAAEQMSRQFYQQLYHSASRDIHSLEANWNNVQYTHTEMKTGSRVRCLQYDDKKIVTGHGDNTIKIWDKSERKLLKELKGHTETVCSLQFNDTVIVSGSADRTVKVWEIQTGQMTTLHHHKGVVRSLKFTMDTLVTGSYDGTVAVWDMKLLTDITLKSSTDITLKSPTDITPMTLKGHKGMVLAVDLSDTKIISGSEDMTVKVWDHLTGDLIQTLCGHHDQVRCLQLQGSHLISGSNDNTLRIWDFDKGKCIQVLHGHAGTVVCVAADNKRILSGSDGAIKVWDLAAALNAGSSSDSVCIKTIKEHKDWVWAMQFDDFQFISGSYDGTLVIRSFLDPTSPFPEI